MIIVAAEAQRKGIGRALMNALLAGGLRQMLGAQRDRLYSRKHPWLMIEVRSNHAFLAFKF